MKICAKCGIEKPLEKFVKDKRKSDGTRNYCLECDRLQRGGKPRPKANYKVCNDCKTELPYSDFNFRKIKGKKRPFSYCKKCERIRDKNRYSHVCIVCKKSYKSGRKDSKLCSVCYYKELGKMGAKTLSQFDFSGKNNPMYGRQRFGKSNPNYNPNKTDEEREKERLVEGYGIWRLEVYTRDSFTCQVCGDDKGGNLTAHHMDSWDWAKDKRLDVSNGITLCKHCHKLFHDKYGYGKNNKNQFHEFINQYANTEVTHQIAKG